MQHGAGAKGGGGFGYGGLEVPPFDPMDPANVAADAQAGHADAAGRGDSAANNSNPPIIPMYTILGTDGR